MKKELDSYELKPPQDPTKTYSVVLDLFGKLIADDSYYSQVMRQFFILVKKGILLDKSEDSKITKLVQTIEESEFRTILYSGFGKDYAPTLFNTLCKVLEAYKTNTDKFKEEIEGFKKELESKVIANCRKGRTNQIVIGRDQFEGLTYHEAAQDEPGF